MSTIGSLDDYYVTGIALAQFVMGGERLGLPSRDILKNCGLEESVHLQPTARVPVSAYEQLIMELILASGDDMLGLHLGQQVMPSAYGWLPILGMTGKTLRESIETTARYQSLVCGNAGELMLSSREDGLLVTLHSVHENPVLRRHVVECVLVLLYRLYRFFMGHDDLFLKRVWLEHTPVSESAAKALEQEFGCEIAYQAGSTGFEINGKLLALPLNPSADVGRVIEPLVAEQLERQQQSGDFLYQIRMLVRDQLVTGVPRRKVVADRLKVSERTLDRRLADAGISWQELLDGQRLQMARDYLRLPDLTVKEVAHKLGFSDSSAFQRRFRVWTGITPSEYRRKYH